MHELSFRAIRPAAVCGSAELLFTEPDRGKRRPPSPAFAGQMHEAFDRHLGGANARGPIAGMLCTLRDATLVVYPGLDGVVISAGGDLVFETCVFTGIDRDYGCLELGRAGPDTIPLPAAFVAFDAAWTNYYHWLCLTAPADPTAITETDAFRRAAARMRAAFAGHRRSPVAAWWRHLAAAAGAPRRRTRSILSRDGLDPRIDRCTQDLLDRIAQPLGFKRVAAEALDLRAQADLFRDAGCVIAPYGAGLGNILFGSPGLRVLELGTALDGDRSLRPWFYLLAHSLEHQYMILDGSAGQFSESRLREAVARLVA